VAAAVWYPTRTDEDPRVLRWAAETYAEFGRQIAAGVPGVLARPTRNLLREPIPGLPWWAGAAGDVTVRAGRGAYVQEVCFVAPLAEMGTYLDWLRRRLETAGGRIEQRRITDLGEVTASVVVNATGLAAGRLCDDPAVRPARGHVVLVDNPGLSESVRDEQSPDGITYVHPRTADVVLGGTFDLDRYDTGPDPDEAAAIVERCTKLVPQLAGARVRGAKIGLRPVRTGGPRVAAETTPDGRRIVHAYGHGGAGMTLSWGCAAEITSLALGSTPPPS
jgi:D-amino-acid oxidase